MRVLMIVPAYPIPTNTGAKRRILAFAKGLSRRHQVTLLALTLPGEVADRIDGTISCPSHAVELKRRRVEAAVQSFFSMRTYRELRFGSREFQDLVGRFLLEDAFDVVWIGALDMLIYVSNLLMSPRQQRTLPILLLDHQHADEIVWSTLTKRSFLWKIFASWEVFKVRRFQARWLHRLDVILAMSEEEGEAISKYINPTTRVWIAPSGVDVNYFQPVRQTRPQRSERVIAFGGSMDVVFNQDAVQWFVDRIFPLIQKEVPKVHFLIVGRNPPSSIWDLARRPGIQVTGTVPDVREFYAQADVFVIPLRLGGGIKLKTLEAMAMAVPIVSTAEGVRGLAVKSGEHVYVADDPFLFADRVVELLRDSHKAASMGIQARRLVEQRYSWERIVSDVEGRLVKLVQESFGD